MNKKQARQIFTKYDNIKLVPCPFCNDKNNPPVLNFQAAYGTTDVDFTIFCTSCGCEPNFHVKTPEEAMHFWNKRAMLPDSEQILIAANITKNLIMNMISKLDVGNIYE